MVMNENPGMECFSHATDVHFSDEKPLPCRLPSRRELLATKLSGLSHECLVGMHLRAATLARASMRLIQTAVRQPNIKP